MTTSFNRDGSMSVTLEDAVFQRAVAFDPKTCTLTFSKAVVDAIRARVLKGKSKGKKGPK